MTRTNEYVRIANHQPHATRECKTTKLKNIEKIDIELN